LAARRRPRRARRRRGGDLRARADGSSRSPTDRAAGGEALPVVADVTREADMEQFVSAAVDRFARLDVMICNAGFGIAGAIDDIAPDRCSGSSTSTSPALSRRAAALRVFRRQGSAT
jgi:NAD(P)-dependent dehydrogenase (short-subunit alcohol dehydrogenase family)